MIIASEPDSREFPKPPAGNHIARCFSIVDLGTHTKIFDKGEEKRLREIRITWELPAELAVFSDEKGEEPFTVSKTFTLSLHVKSKLRATLESWRGRKFTEEELKGFDLAKVLGVACMVQVSVDKAENGRTYANVVSVTTTPKGMPVPPPVNDCMEYSLDHHDVERFALLPKRTQELIMTSEEWVRMSGDDAAGIGF